MRTEPNPRPGDLARAPFSNATDAEIWLSNVCGAGKGCVHDSMYGQEDDYGDEIHCPLITLSMMQVWPHEWERVRVPFTTVEGVDTYYQRPGDCTEYTDTYPTPQPDPVIAVDLFGEFQTEPTP